MTAELASDPENPDTGVEAGEDQVDTNDSADVVQPTEVESGSKLLI